jgi:predicted adenylyl cyclase CyaB
LKVINIEIKARSDRNDHIRDLLRARNAEFRGEDHQVDTYFKSASGRLKLREGRIENNLIYYERPDHTDLKTSRCILFKTEPGSSLKKILEKSMGVIAIVDKIREIYFLDNVKIHLDHVSGLGTFVEIEAQSEEGDLGEDYLQEQCSALMKDFGIRRSDLLSHSYSDMISGNQFRVSGA